MKTVFIVTAKDKPGDLSQFSIEFSDLGKALDCLATMDGQQRRTAKLFKAELLEYSVEAKLK